MFDAYAFEHPAASAIWESFTLAPGHFGRPALVTDGCG
jgi:hypothetical protein